MKKKLITIIIGMVFCIGWIGGCASKETNHDNVATSVTEESKQEGVKKEKELTGTIDEIKDFQFVIIDDENTPYSFTFEEKPEGLENVSNGDTVTVRYTGTISDANKLWKPASDSPSERPPAPENKSIIFNLSEFIVQIPLSIRILNAYITLQPAEAP